MANMDHGQPGQHVKVFANAETRSENDTATVHVQCLVESFVRVNHMSIEVAC